MPAPSRYRALVALAEAYPFAASEAFEHGILGLRRTELDDPASATAMLATGFEAHARVLARGHSLATIAAIRDRAWFGEAERPLASQLLALAKQHLSWDGDCIRLVPCLADHRHDRGMRWRWLSLRLPQDLLIAAIAAAEQQEPSSDRVRLVDEALAPLLEQPVAETHLHVGAALDFGDLWLAVLEGTTHHGFVGSKFGAGPPPFVAPGAYKRVLVAAGLVRQLLAAFLWRREFIGSTTTFSEFLAERLPEIAKQTGASSRAWAVERSCWTALAQLRTGLGRADASLAELRRAHCLLWGPGHRPKRLDDLVARDPIAHWLPPGPGLARPETRFLQRALAYLSRSHERDDGFAQGFWQYIRVRNLVFSHLVQNPGTAGLGWFARHYNRLWSHRGCLNDRVTETALRLHSRDLNLRSLEVRTAPAERWYEVRSNLRRVAEQAERFEPDVGRDRPEIGMVLHFIKSKPTQGRYVYRCRYGRWFQANWARAGAVARALRLNPELLLVLRGLDVAADELAIPTWVLLPLFERVRSEAKIAAARLARARPHWRVRPVRTTLHVGEEFRRLIEGLRNVHEAVEFGLLTTGDRIGHGLALGWAPDVWVNSNPVSVQPLDARLADLIWELERYEQRDLVPARGRESYVHAQLYKLGKELFGHSVSSASLVAFRRRLFDQQALRGELHFPYGRRALMLGDDDRMLAARYLLDPVVHERAARLIEVDAGDDERDLLAAVQRWLCAHLGRLGVTVEANPSSNLLIADFEDLREHPTFRLAPLEGDEPAHGYRLPVSINSDDPLTFASCLADEYSYMQFALIGREIATQSARRWIADAREAAWQSRFTLEASADPSCLLELTRRAQGSA